MDLISALPTGPDRTKTRQPVGRALVRSLGLIAFLITVTSHAVPSHARRSVAPSQHGRPATGAPAQPAVPFDEARSLAELAALQDQKLAAEQAAETLRADLRRVQAELVALRQASANVLQIQAERDNLQEQLIRIERELVTIRRAKAGLEEDNRQTWFLSGAGVLLAGIAVGLILSRLSQRRRNGWDSY